MHATATVVPITQTDIDNITTTVPFVLGEKVTLVQVWHLDPEIELLLKGFIKADELGKTWQLYIQGTSKDTFSVTDWQHIQLPTDWDSLQQSSTYLQSKILAGCRKSRELFIYQLSNLIEDLVSANALKYNRQAMTEELGSGSYDDRLNVLMAGRRLVIEVDDIGSWVAMVIPEDSEDDLLAWPDASGGPTWYPLTLNKWFPIATGNSPTAVTRKLERRIMSIPKQYFWDYLQFSDSLCTEVIKYKYDFENIPSFEEANVLLTK